MTIEARPRERGIVPPAPSPPAGNYAEAVIAGNLACVAGHGPRRTDGGYVTGKIGAEVSVEETVEADGWSA